MFIMLEEKQKTFTQGVEYAEKKLKKDESAFNPLRQLGL